MSWGVSPWVYPIWNSLCFLDLGDYFLPHFREIITQVPKTQRVLNRINPRRNSPRHILIKLTKIKHKEQILKAATEKQQITHKGIPIRITADLSIETLQARREWQHILKVMKDNNLQPRLLYPARISFKHEGEIKTFTHKQTLREFSTTKRALQQILKDILMIFLSVFFFWDSYNSNVGAFHIVLEVSEIVLISFNSLFLFPL